MQQTILLCGWKPVIVPRETKEKLLMFGEVEIRAEEQISISASHGRGNRVLGWLSVLTELGKQWGQVHQRHMLWHIKGLAWLRSSCRTQGSYGGGSSFYNSAYLASWRWASTLGNQLSWWNWSFIMETQKWWVIYLLGHNDTEQDDVKRVQDVMLWELQLQPWWSPQVSWESGVAHSSGTYDNGHLCSFPPASISIFFN